MSSGSVSGLAAESKAIWGTAFWPAAGNPAGNAATTNSGNRRLMRSLLLMLHSFLSGARCLRGHRLQDELLGAPRFDFTNDDLVRVAAIHHVDDLEAAEFLAGVAEPADDCPVQLQLVDLPRDIPGPGRIAVGVGVGGKDVLVRARRNADGPTNTKVVVGGLRLEVIVQDLVPEVGAVGHPDVALPINLEPVRQAELTRFLAGLLAARLSEKPAVLVELHHPVVAVSIGDKNIALRVEAHVRRAAENVLLRRRVCARGSRDGAVNRRRPAAEHHEELALRAELRDGVRAFVDGPDVVLRIDADRVRELEAVITLADFLEVVAVLIEFPQPGVGAAVVDEDM